MFIHLQIYIFYLSICSFIFLYLVTCLDRYFQIYVFNYLFIQKRNKKIFLLHVFVHKYIFNLFIYFSIFSYLFRQVFPNVCIYLFPNVFISTFFLLHVFIYKYITFIPLFYYIFLLTLHFLYIGSGSSFSTWS